MAKTEYSETWILEFQETREALADKDAEVFDTIIINDNIEAA